MTVQPSASTRLTSLSVLSLTDLTSDLIAYGRSAEAVHRAEAIANRFSPAGTQPVGARPMTIDLLGRGGDAATLKNVLHSTAAVLKEQVLAAEADQRRLAVLFVIDADAAMGDPDEHTEQQYWEAAIAGAALSMARTLAIELVKPGHCVNALLVGAQIATEQVALDLLAAQAALLLTQSRPVITGQQIFAAGSRDAGRLQP